MFLVTGNYVDGKEFISLTQDEVKEMVPPLGLAKKVLRLIPQVSTHGKNNQVFVYRSKKPVLAKKCTQTQIKEPLYFAILPHFQ